MIRFIFTAFLLIVHPLAYSQPKPDSTLLSSLKVNLHEYFNAKNDDQKKKVVKKIIKQKPGFDRVYHLLKTGKSYDSTIRKGLIELRLPASDDRAHYFLVYIPITYNPHQKYTVEIKLHGAVTGFEETAILDNTVSKNVDDYEKYNHIIVYPAGWYLAQWCSTIQTENILNLISYLKDRYNIDENQIYLSGCSDGGTGTFYFANTIPTYFSSFTASVACLSCLRNIDKEFYPVNLINKPFMALNGKKDQLFKAEVVSIYIDLLEKNGVQLNYTMIDSAGHLCDWGPALTKKINSFKKDHSRNPYPDTIHWQSENDSLYNRCHWYVMNKLGITKNDFAFKEANLLILSDTTLSAFKREKNSGRVFIVKTGNVVHVNTSGIKKYTLLLSPEHFDFNSAVTVYTNGSVSFHGKVEKSLETLFKWNLKDKDRAMLFATEMVINVDAPAKQDQ